MSPLVRESESDTLVAQYARTHDATLREAIIEGYRPLVRWVANRFRRPGAEAADLVQVAWIALIEALDRYDPARGTAFSSYAVRCMAGAIKRYFRDCTWVVRVPRRLQQLALGLPRLRERVLLDLGREPTVPEMAAACGASEEELVEAIEVTHGRWILPLGDPSPEAGDGETCPLEEKVGAEDPGIETCVERLSQETLLQRLPPRERVILRRRFYDERTQREVGRELGLSQMQISRLERAALARLAAVRRVSA
jgi:RNA polymerase sigma-B factor